MEKVQRQASLTDQEQVSFDRFKDRLQQLGQAAQTYQTPFTIQNAKQSILAFKGDVYTGLQAADFSAADFEFAQIHLRILSGLYGVLKPMDLMQPYRLEMGTSLKNGKYKNLYEFWDTKITNILNKDAKESGQEVIVNLASKEYFREQRRPKTFLCFSTNKEKI